MALKFDVSTEQERIDEVGMARRFGNNLPENIASMAGAKAAAAAQIQLGAELMKESGEAIVRENANQVEIAKDPETGQYVRPESPMLMGLAHRDTYNRIVDERFLTTIYRDAEADLNVLGAKHQDNPKAAQAAFGTHVASVLEKVDPSFHTRLAPLLQREVNERQRGILSRAASRDRENSINFEQTEIANQRERAQALMILGDQKGAEDAVVKATQHQLNLIDMNAIDPRSIKHAHEIHAEIKTGAKVLAHVNTLVEKGLVSAESLDKMIRSVENGTDEKSFGIHGVEILKELPDPRDRAKLGQHLRGIRSTLGNTFQQQAIEANFQRFQDFYRSNPGHGRSTGFTKEEQNAGIAMAAARAKVDLRTPEGADWAARNYGYLPEQTYQTIFEGAASKGGKPLEELYVLYEKLGATNFGNGDHQNLLKAEDQAFMFHYSNLRRSNGYDAGSAEVAAKQLLKEGHAKLKDVGDMNGYLVGKLREKLDVGAQYVGTEQVEERITKEMKGRNLGGYHDLPFDTQLAIKTNIVQQHALMGGTPDIDKAIADGVARLQRTHVVDPFHPKAKDGGSPMTPRAQAVRPVTNSLNPDQREETAYVGNTVTALFKANKDLSVPEDGSRSTAPLIPMKQHGFEMKDPKLGENVFLQPIGQNTENPTFRLVWRPDPSYPKLGSQITNADGEPVIVSLEAARKAQQNLRDQQWDERRQELEDAGYARRDQERANLGLIDKRAAGHYDAGIFSSYKPPTDQAPINLRETLIVKPSEIGGLNSAGAPGAKVKRGSGGIGSGVVSDEGWESVLTPGQNPKNLLRTFTTHPSVNVSGLSDTFAGRLAAMIADAPKDVADALKISSGKRSTERQAQIYADHVAAGTPHLAARPGHSLHERGEAADIPELKRNLAARKWAHENAARYGLHFPLDGRNGRPREVWHIEPIGSRKMSEIGSDSVMPHDDDEPIEVAGLVDTIAGGIARAGRYLRGEKGPPDGGRGGGMGIRA